MSAKTRKWDRCHGQVPTHTKYHARGHGQVLIHARCRRSRATGFCKARM